MAPESAVATRIRTALAAELKRDVSNVRLEDNLRSDLGLDSLAMIELVFKIEEGFDLEIPNEDLARITTVGDVVAYVEERLATPAAPSAPGVAAGSSAAPQVRAPAQPPAIAAPPMGQAPKTAKSHAPAAAVSARRQAPKASARKVPLAAPKGRARKVEA